MILAVAPEYPLEHTLLYLVDTITSWNGTEQRIAIRRQPKQVFNPKIRMDNEEDLRALRADLYLNTNDDVYFPLWHERVVISTNAASGQATVTGDFSKSDLAVDDEVLLMTRGGEYEFGVVNTKSDSNIVLGGNLAASFPRGSSVYPVRLFAVNDQAGINTFPTTASEASVTLEMLDTPALPGYGAAALTTYDSLVVLDQRPLISGTSADIFERAFERMDTEHSIFQYSPVPYASVVTAKRFLSRSPAERQRWKLFFYTIVGGREPFWAPTWKPDLELNAQPGATTSFTVQGDFYKTTYYDTNAIKDFQFELADGTVVYRRATNCVDNGNGTQTITVNSALPATAIEVVSFLEKCRLGSGTVSYSHNATYSELKFSVVTVQG